MKEILRKTIFYRLYKKSRWKFADIIFSSPSKGLKVIWVTWTDGKTTTVNMIHKVFNDNLGKTALVWTAWIKIGEQEITNEKKMTSFDPFDLQKLLSTFKESWCEYVILEVSSHGIDQYRFEGIEFDMAVLTNITPEHLDYHGTMENYADTKKRLFKEILINSKVNKFAVLPKDSDFGRKWIEDLPFDKMLDYWIFTNSTVKWDNIQEFYDHTTFDLKYLWKTYPVNLNMLWKYNVQNSLAAVCTWVLFWIRVEDIIRSLESFEGVNWRMEMVEHNDIKYFIDFAHTPNWLENVLKFLTTIKGNWRVITMFWAPWNRDKKKRPLMGNIVDKYSDVVVLTDDDPDTENRYDIIAQVGKWISRTEWNDYFIVPEREFAIKLAAEVAKKWDLVLLAWKWHETVQLTNFWKRDWSDKKELMKTLNIS